MSPRVLIVVAIVLVVLFVIAAGLGVSKNGPPRAADRNANWAANLDQLLASPRPLQPGDVSGTCLGQPVCVVPANTSTQVVVARAADNVRQARVHLVAGTSLQVRLPQKSSLDQTKTISTGATENFDIYQDGGTLTLTCGPPAAAAPACRVELSR